MIQGAEVYDILVIGGGVIGCAILHELTREGYKCVLVEKNDSLVMQASAGNSGIVHTGFDATPGLIESQCLIESRELQNKLLMDYGIPVRRIGAIVVAWTEEELLKLPVMYQNAVEMGVMDVRILSRAELLLMEPNLSKSALGGMLVPGEMVADSWLLPITLAHEAVRHGAKIYLSCNIKSGQFTDSKLWNMCSSRGPILARVVVNAAGLHGDRVEDICQPSNFSIRPRNGQFVVYDNSAGDLIKHIILPVPSETTKGIIVYPSVHGNLVVGPTAEDCDERDDPLVSGQTSAHLVNIGERIVPLLSQDKVIHTYAGLRPATTESKDYHLGANMQRSWVTVGGIRSTGLSACLSIAKRVFSMISDQLQVRPSKRLRIWRPGGSSVWITESRDAVVMDGIEYTITHPLSRLGLGKKMSKL